MKQMPILFKDNTDIPEAHFHAFKACNSASLWHYKQSFYRLKNEILQKYGHEADYDLQIIKKQCYFCNGTGKFKLAGKLPETCWSCNGSGIYQTKKVVLKRWLLNGEVFHNPVGDLYFGDDNLKIFDGYEDGYPKFRYEKFRGKIVNQIEGVIKHEPVKLNITWAFYYLLWNYKREYFFKLITKDVNYYQTWIKQKLKKMLNLSNPLKVFADFFKVKKQQLEPIDDLPF